MTRKVVGWIFFVLASFALAKLLVYELHADIEMFAYCLIFLAILPFFGYGLAKRDLFFTLMKSNEIKIVVKSSGVFVRIILGIDGYKATQETRPDKIKIIPLGPGEKTERNFLEQSLGMYWIGIPPFRRIHTFPIIRQRIRQAIAKNSTPDQWLDTENEPVTVNSIRFIFPRPFVLTKVELKDRLTVDLLVNCKFRTVLPYKPTLQFNGAFFANAGSIVQAGIMDILREKNIMDFIGAPKNEVDGLLAELKLEPVVDANGVITSPFGRVNFGLEEQVGLALEGISIERYVPADTEIVEAIRQTALAEEVGNAAIKKATKDGEARVIQANREAEALERLATARNKTIANARLAFSGPDGDKASPDVAAQSTASLLRAETLTGTTSKLTTLVDGSGAVVAIPPKGDK